MKITLSKSQWEQIGKQAGWLEENAGQDIHEALNNVYGLLQHALQYAKAIDINPKYDEKPSDALQAIIDTKSTLKEAQDLLYAMELRMKSIIQVPNLMGKKPI